MARVFVCPRCLYETDRKSNIVSHLYKLNACRSVTGVTIEEARRQHHIKYDEVKQDDKNVTPASTDMSQLINVIIDLKNEVKQMNTKIQSMDSNMKSISSKMEDMENTITKLTLQSGTGIITDNSNTINTNTSTNTNSNNNNVHNEISININNFGQENLDYITGEFAMKCFEKGANGVLAMVDKIYFDKEHVENNTVRLKNLREKIVEVIMDKEWVQKGLGATVDTMIGVSRNKIISDAIPLIDAPADHRKDDELLTKLNNIQNMNNKASKKLNESVKAKLSEHKKQTRSKVKA